MNLLANNLSIHEQFRDRSTFQAAFRGLMALRGVAQHFRREVYCHRDFYLLTMPIPGQAMVDAFQGFNQNECRAAMSWLTRGGPFWDDERRHGPDDYLECNDDIVTNSPVGEAAYQTIQGIECALVSATPSDWDYSPVHVTWHRGDENRKDTKIENFREPGTLKKRLCTMVEPIKSWQGLQEVCSTQFECLAFADDCFEPLRGFPFASGAMKRIRVLFNTLNQFARSFDEITGQRTPEGQQIYQDHFTGENAWFSDSSDREKRGFENQLTFPHPSNTQESLFCPWHGKVRHPTLRLHFSWPIRHREPVHVVYVGQKITRG